MKITSIDAMQLPSGNAGASSRGAWSPVLVRINTDVGVCGWGEAGLAYGKGWRAGLGMIQDFAEQIIGMDPMNTEEIWEAIFRKTFWGMGSGTIVSAGMSAIDIALMDLKGKFLNVPVYQLLGGKTNKKLRTYASQIHVCGSPISKAAALQIEAAIPNFLIHEHHQRALNPVNRATCVHDYQPESGRRDGLSCLRK